MQDKNSNDEDPYIAHQIEDDNEIQPVSAHNRETAGLAEMRCPVENMTPVVYLAGVFHDAGKYSNGFQDYIKQTGEEKYSRRGDVNHATAGGVLIEECVPGSNLSELIQLAIYSHHGVYDAVNMEKGEALIEKRQSKSYQEKEKIELENVRQRFYQYTDKEKIDAVCGIARKSLRASMTEIQEFYKWDVNRFYGSRDFYLGMQERLLMSLLIDADRSNTASFMNKMQASEMPKGERDRRTEYIWQECIGHFENYISKFEIKTRIDRYRKEISEACLAAAESRQNLYRLTLPTGSGKTLGSLRFALHHAKRFSKQRIIYVAPFNSILEQNADEIRSAVGIPELVLEHHCNVILEDAKEQERYDRLTENWMHPIVATTAVQFLNTLFSSKTGSVRRMHSLCDSIILFDEVQSLPVRVISLFNLAVNYLTAFCNTTVVLCSATQPVFDKMPQNRLLPPKELVEDYTRYDAAFRRVTVMDKTGIWPGGLSTASLGGFILKQIPDERQMLVIVNTKKCAKNLYEYLKTRVDQECAIFHLSTNMCVLHRHEVLDKVRALLGEEKNSKPVICISTQLIEAGVDLSFDCVIRSLAGLDNVIQAAGRCNRHGKKDNGNVYVVRMSKEAEDVSHLGDIRAAQEVMEELLRRYREQPDSVGGDLLSDKAKEQFYLMYLQKQAHKVDFHVNINGAQTTIVDLLSGNKLAQEQYVRNAGKRPGFLLKQAFKTAGEQFEVISEEGKVNVVVKYNPEIAAMMEELKEPYITFVRQKEILRHLQMASIGISEQMKNRLGRAITPVCGGLVNELSSLYYSNETGVSEEPAGMELLNM